MARAGSSPSAGADAPHRRDVSVARGLPRAGPAGESRAGRARDPGRPGDAGLGFFEGAPRAVRVPARERRARREVGPLQLPRHRAGARAPAARARRSSSRRRAAPRCAARPTIRSARSSACWRRTSRWRCRGCRASPAGPSGTSATTWCAASSACRRARRDDWACRTLPHARAQPARLRQHGAEDQGRRARPRARRRLAGRRLRRRRPRASTSWWRASRAPVEEPRGTGGARGEVRRT